jgi:polyvinyl alcohol dehydrogenase (cytochrome)
MATRTGTAVFIAACGLLACSGDPEKGLSSTIDVARDDLKGGSDWRIATYDSTGSANNRREHRIGRRNAGDLELKWTFGEAESGAPVGAIHATPVVADSETYVGSFTGTFYAIDENGGQMWSRVTLPPDPVLAAFLGPAAPIVAGAALPSREDTVLFGDVAGVVYKLDRRTGAELWRVDVSSHPLAGVWGSLLVTGDLVYVPFAAFEPLAPLISGYTCCTHRGGIVALDLETGAVRWRYEAIRESEQGPLPPELIAQLGGVETFGPSGADVWTAPTLDEERHTLYVGTGQLFSRAADGTGPRTYDAVIALDSRTGSERWVTQFSDSLDVFRFDVANPDPATGIWVDRDISGSPKLYRLHGRHSSRKVVAVGQKNGEFHVLDAHTGEALTTETYLAQAVSEGGFQTGGAVDSGIVLEHGVTTAASPGAPYDGKVLGIAPDGRRLHWEITRPGSPLFGGLAVANGVTYFQSPFEEPVSTPGNPATWALFAVDVDSGAVLKRMPFAGRAMNGPVVSRGRVYAGFGNAVVNGITGADPAGGVVCLGLPVDD